MEKVRLEEICELITDGTHQTPTYSKEGYIFLSSKNVTSRKIDWQNIKYISEELHRELIKRVIPKKNDILLAKNGTTGVGAIVDKEIEFDIYVSLALLRPNDKVLPRYLFWAVNSPAAKRKFDASLKGIGVKNLHLSAIKKIEINIYNKETQEKIIKVLDKLQKILEERQKLLENLDLLSKCLFIKMFGDPILNEKRWENKYWKEVLTIKNGRTQKKVEDVNGRYPIYGSGGVIGYANEYICNENSVIIGRKGNINKPILVLEKFWNVDTAFGLEPSEKILSVYYLYDFCKKYNFEIHNKAVTIPSLVKGDLQNIKIPLPPIELQKQYEKRVKLIEKSKFEIQQSIDETQKLFNSLMEKYFG